MSRLVLIQSQLYDSIVQNITEVESELCALQLEVTALEAERSDLQGYLKAVTDGMGGVPADLTLALLTAPIALLGEVGAIVPIGPIEEEPSFPPEKLETPVVEQVARPIKASSEFIPPGWQAKPEQVGAPRSKIPTCPDEFGSDASTLASKLQRDWEGFLAETPRVPRPKSSPWQAGYSPEDYVLGLVALALVGQTTLIPATSIKHIRESDGALIGYIHLLESRAGTAQRERFCVQLLAQQKARVKS